MFDWFLSVQRPDSKFNRIEQTWSEMAKLLELKSSFPSPNRLDWVGELNYHNTGNRSFPHLSTCSFVLLQQTECNHFIPVKPIVLAYATRAEAVAELLER